MCVGACGEVCGEVCGRKFVRVFVCGGSIHFFTRTHHDNLGFCLRVDVCYDCCINKS
jgi:hypothetical protein